MHKGVKNAEYMKDLDGSLIGLNSAHQAKVEIWFLNESVGLTEWGGGRESIIGRNPNSDQSCQKCAIRAKKDQVRRMPQSEQKRF